MTETNLKIQGCIESMQLKVKNLVEKLKTRYGRFMLLFIAALVVDTASTVWFMAETGPGDEIHPLVRMSSEVFGIVAGPIIGAAYKIIAVLIVTAYLRRFAEFILTISAVSYSLAACYNLWALDLYNNGLIGWLPF